MDPRVQAALENAVRIPVTDDEDKLFKRGEAALAINMVSERTRIPLSSGRVAYAPAIKCLLIVD